MANSTKSLKNTYSPNAKLHGFNHTQNRKKLLYTSLITTGSGLKISITHSSISDNKSIQKISFRNPDLQYKRL